MDGSAKRVLQMCVCVCLAFVLLVGVSYAKYRDEIQLDSFSLSVVVADVDPSVTLVGIFMEQAPNRTVYAVGDDFDDTGLVVMGQYGDGSESVISNYTLKNHENLDLSQTSVGVSCGSYELAIPIQMGYRVTYNGNGGQFNRVSKNAVIVASGEQIVSKISKTDNVSDDGLTYGEAGYGDDQEWTDVITIPGATELEVTITYGTESMWYDWVAVYDATVIPTVDNYDDSVSGALGDEDITTKTFTIPGDTVQIFFVSDESTSEYYGYYAVVTATVPGSEIIDGVYKEPTRGGYAFDGWYLNSSCTSGYEFDETGVVNMNLTAYASWLEIYPVELIVTTQPEVTQYRPGDDFDDSGMIVTVVYSNGDTQVITDYDLYDNTDLAYDQTQVLVSYTDIYSGETVETIVPIEIVFPQAVYIELTGKLIFTVTTNLEPGDLYQGNYVTAVYTDFETGLYDSEQEVPWYEYQEDITSVVFASEIKPENTAYWFAGMSNLTTVDLSCLDTTNVDSVNSMFVDCSSLRVLDLRRQDMSNVSDMDDMVSGCTSITRAFAANESDMDLLNASLNRPDNWRFWTLPGRYDTDEDFDRLVARYAQQYINEYRVAEGSPSLEWVDGLMLVSEYRADQAITNFRHDPADMQEAADYCEYGQYYANHWHSEASEGLTSFGFVLSGDLEVDAELMGQRIADNFYNSAGHWSYIGSATNIYVGIGVEFMADADDADVLYGRCCISVSSQKYE